MYLNKETLKIYVCDTCKRGYYSQKCLQRHIKEKHVDEKCFPCYFSTCKATFIRRSYLLTHLHKVHKLERNIAKSLSTQVRSVLREHFNIRNSATEEISGCGEFFENSQMKNSEVAEEKLFQDINDILEYDFTMDVNYNVLDKFVTDEVVYENDCSTQGISNQGKQITV